MPYGVSSFCFSTRAVSGAATGVDADEEEEEDEELRPGSMSTTVICNVTSWPFRLVMAPSEA